MSALNFLNTWNDTITVLMFLSVIPISVSVVFWIQLTGFFPFILGCILLLFFACLLIFDWMYKFI